MPALFLAFAEQWKPRIDEALLRHAEDVSGCPVPLAEAIRYALLSPGKRLRPLLTLAAAEAFGGNPETAMDVACAVEMIHAYSLVHDDVPAMDNSDLRRGKPTVHVAFGEAEAILAGDALLTLAFDIIASSPFPPERVVDCIRVLAAASGRSGMVGGQSDDLRLAAKDDASLVSLHERKTGSLIAASLEMGGVIAGASAEERRMLQSIGKDAGIAFQIADDLLDGEGSVALLGKPVGSDRANDKVTFLSFHGKDQSRRRAGDLVARCEASLAPLGERGSVLQSFCRFTITRYR
jgi:geranylgeranyl diphosphate synthase type II